MNLDLEQYRKLAQSIVDWPPEGELEPVDYLARGVLDLRNGMDQAQARIGELEERAEVGRLMEKLPLTWSVYHMSGGRWSVIDLNDKSVAVGDTLLEALRAAIAAVGERERWETSA